jgi:hypothetical protein
MIPISNRIAMLEIRLIVIITISVTVPSKSIVRI